MTEEERPEAKEREACFAAIREIIQEISRLMDAAYQHNTMKPFKIIDALFRLQFEETEDGDTDTEEVKT